MDSNRKALRRWGVRGTVVGLAVAGVTTFATAAATSASAVVKNINTLCKPHGGVDQVGKDWVQCGDGTVFEFDYPI